MLALLDMVPYEALCGDGVGGFWMPLKMKCTAQASYLNVLKKGGFLHRTAIYIILLLLLLLLLLLSLFLLVNVLVLVLVHLNSGSELFLYFGESTS